MTKIADLSDFNMITSSITSFSHAYLFSVNLLEPSLFYAKEFAKRIILQDIEVDSFIYDDITYKIDHDEFDDLYIVNPDTIGINSEEISKLMNYMETKSLRENGRRVYIIYGFERLSNTISNKILKFLEEPPENIYAILLTENIEKILSTIVSRCQLLNLTFPNINEDKEKISSMKDFISNLFNKKNKMIAYELDYFKDYLTNRIEFYNSFELLEKIISESLSYKYNDKVQSDLVLLDLLNYSPQFLINILNITNKLKCLVKNNINLNLLLDRYIIEITEELELCKK